ncbi:hypothetical protein CDIK_3984 [Cucumispora dikerogammari]|nr:hypothetical protein CDIK_3984 [Cucumispora dikerogammari]
MNEILKTNCFDNSEVDSYKLNETIYFSFCVLRDRDIFLNDLVLKTVTLKVAARSSILDFKPLKKWFFGFKEKNKIKFKTLKRKSKLTDTKAATLFLKNSKALFSNIKAKIFLIATNRLAFIDR